MYTSIEDINVHMMINTPLESLKQLCQTNQWAYHVCQDFQFWKKKYRHDRFIRPYFDDDSQIDWHKTYIIMYNVYYMINNITKQQINLNTNVNLYEKIYTKLIINNYTPINGVIDRIIIKGHFNKFHIETSSYVHVGMHKISFDVINLLQLRRLLFYLFYYNLVRAIKKIY